MPHSLFHKEGVRQPASAGAAGDAVEIFAVEPHAGGRAAVKTACVYRAVIEHDLGHVLLRCACAVHLTPVDNEHQHRAVGALADRGTGVRTGIEDCGVLHLAVDYEHRLKGHAVHDALRLCVGIGHIAGVQDVIRVEADEAACSAAGIIIAYTVDYCEPLRRAAKTGAIRVIICAAVDAADRAVALAHGGQIVAVAAEGFRLADEHAAGVEHI